MNRTSQTARILKYLREHPNQEISAIALHRVGSGKEHGFLASLSRRISDCRELLDEWESLSCRRETQPEGSVNTFYELHSHEFKLYENHTIGLGTPQ